jgi:mono/diheme cytochrome c family protein
MLNRATGSLQWTALGAAAVLAVASSCHAQGNAVLDQAVLEQGRALYEANCSMCHQQTGSGIPPDFPALDGNANLGDLALIVENVHLGKGAMPSFPDLTAEEIAAVATYGRNAWSNAFGAVSAMEVETAMAGLGEVGERVSVWSGVYSEAQAERGQSVFLSVCARCHGPRGNGAGDPEMTAAPPVARGSFLRKWDRQTVATLLNYVRTTMPTDNPKSLSDQQYLDAITYMFMLSNMPTGDAELELDEAALTGVEITQAQ